MRYHLVSALVAVASLTPVVSAVLSMSKIADQCADTSGFNTCWNNALSTAQECYQQHCEGEGTCDSENDCTSSNGDCVQVCSCLAYAQMINCAITSCWNMVFGCEYQNLAISAARYCPTALGGSNPPFNTDLGWIWIPFFPSNSSRPGACSCNIAWVYLDQRSAISEHTTCSNKEDTGYACACCEMSKDVSAFYNTCPNTDPAAAIGDMPNFPVGLFQDTSQCADLPDCTSYGFLPPSEGSSGVFYEQDNIPANGTDPLSNNAGENTTPAFPTITWVMGNGLPTYTAVAVTTGSPAQSGGSGGESNPASQASGAASTSAAGSSGAGSGSGTGTGTGSASTASPTHSSAERGVTTYVANWGLPLIASVFAMLFL